MNTRAMPRRGEMVEAFLSRDGTYDGMFFTGVRTTGIFCRPTCSAKKPREENVEFFSSTQAALLAGFRRRPMEPSGSRPAWLRELMRDFDAQPEKRWTDQDLRNRGLSPERVRRWFQSHHGMTFHAYGRAR
jgi:AraC family transcriptional regulator of adaptative response/methylated-DNA-[protein]-cysteine methyltransferase